MPSPAIPAARTPRARGEVAIPITASTPAATIAHRSAGYHPGVHPSSTKDHAALAATARHSAIRGNSSTRRCHR